MDQNVIVVTKWHYSQLFLNKVIWIRSFAWTRRDNRFWRIFESVHWARAPDDNHSHFPLRKVLRQRVPKSLLVPHLILKDLSYKHMYLAVERRSSTSNWTAPWNPYPSQASWSRCVAEVPSWGCINCERQESLSHAHSEPHKPSPLLMKPGKQDWKGPVTMTKHAWVPDHKSHTWSNFTAWMILGTPRPGNAHRPVGNNQIGCRKP